jgi:hypothetical protein
MATGFHGFHVLVGTIFLIVCLIRAAKGHFKPKHHFGFEAAAWYWHFVDVVWLFLFFAIYWWGEATGNETRYPDGRHDLHAGRRRRPVLAGPLADRTPAVEERAGPAD